MKQKRFYEKPQMEVFELRQQPQILAGSDKGLDPLSPFAPGGSPLP